MSLTLENITKCFGSKKIFEDFSYNFFDRGVYAIVGDSGIGKTTLLRIIAGLDTDFNGQVIGGGLQNTAFAFQEYRLFPQLTAIENAVIPNGDMKDDELVNQAKRMLLDLGFTESELAIRPNELSGGMKQRVSLVRAFLKNAPILLLDEPTKELDEDLRNTLYKMIVTESKKRLVIIVSHHKEDFNKIRAEKIFI